MRFIAFAESSSASALTGYSVFCFFFFLYFRAHRLLYGLRMYNTILPFISRVLGRHAGNARIFAFSYNADGTAYTPFAFASCVWLHTAVRGSGNGVEEARLKRKPRTRKETANALGMSPACPDSTSVLPEIFPEAAQETCELVIEPVSLTYKVV